MLISLGDNSMISIRVSLALLFFVVWAGHAPSLFAQGGATGALNGTVVDASGGIIAGAGVKITDERPGHLVPTLTTTSSGTFAAALLPPAPYTVVVSANGFGDQRAKGVEVRVTEITAITLTLQPSQVKQEVTVQAEVVTVNTENPATGQ